MVRPAMMLRGLFDFVLPAGCIVCRTWVPSKPPARPPLVCGACRSRLAVVPWPRCPRCHAPRGTGRRPANDCLECRAWPTDLTDARYAYALVSPASDLVHALKYGGWRELAEPMGEAIARAFTAGGAAMLARGGPDVVVPVPTTAQRRATRGYNQAALLAEVVASSLARPVVDALTRRYAATSQTSLAPEERRDNVRGAFGLACAPEIEGSDVLLVDDVLTTGATAGEAARTLVRGGARGVSLAVYGRALPRYTRASSGHGRV